MYYDIVSGTKAETRPDLQRLLTDCANGDVNLVLVKSVSRFARNTTDLLKMVRSLTGLGVDIIFDREHLDTRVMGSEFLLTVLASLAEDESHSIAANCRWGIQERFRNGSYRAASAPYGFDLYDGGFFVNEEEAEIVKEIFKRTADGEPMRRIAEDLNERGIPTKRAGQVWNGEEVSGQWTAYTIHKMLKNEAYVGDLELQKTYKDRSFKHKKNKGELPKYYVENHHPRIVEKEVFDVVREIMEARKTNLVGSKKQYLLTGKMCCSICGSPLIRQVNRVKSVYWICRKHRHKASECSMTPVAEENMWKALGSALTKLAADISPLSDYIRSLEDEYRETNRSELDSLETRLDEIEESLRTLTSMSARQKKANILIRQNELKSEKMDIRSQLERMTDNRITESKENVCSFGMTVVTVCPGAVRSFNDGRITAEDPMIPLILLFMVCFGIRFLLSGAGLSAPVLPAYVDITVRWGLSQRLYIGSKADFGSGFAENIRIHSRDFCQISTRM